MNSNAHFVHKIAFYNWSKRSKFALLTSILNRYSFDLTSFGDSPGTFAVMGGRLPLQGTFAVTGDVCRYEVDL